MMMKTWKVICILYLTNYVYTGMGQFCYKDSPCQLEKSKKPRFLLYDVNQFEGFNLRRDVYMRLAIFVHSLRNNGSNWVLVLPPWPLLYHWKTQDINQSRLPWSTFFDVQSLKGFVPVIEFEDFLQEIKDSNKIDKIYSLQHFKNAFSESNWDWTDKWNITNCKPSVLCREATCHGSAYVYEDNAYHGWFWGFPNVTASSLQCLSFQGPASLLKQVFDIDSDLSIVMIDHAEIVVHDTFGDSLYWKCRRSMRFAKHLEEEALIFRTAILGGNDKIDGTERPSKWEYEEFLDDRGAVGGPYICAHLRRADYLNGRAEQVPSLEFAAKQIKDVLEATNLKTVFIASDASNTEINKLIEYIKPARAVVYIGSYLLKERFKDGGLAIIDQIICSYARYFIGTHESTFTFRIQEEREIISFPTETTFNLFCATPQKCFNASRWTIVYGG